LPICLDVTVMGWGNPVGLSIGSFAQWDLEVRIHSVTNIPIWGLLIGLGVPFNSGFEPFDFVFEGQDGEAMDFFAILDGLDQTSCNLSEGDRVNIGVGGEYVLHSTRGVAGWG